MIEIIKENAKWGLIFGVSVVIGGLMLYEGLFGVQERAKLGVESSNWPKTEGVIITSEIDERVVDHESGTTKEYWDLSYSYSVDDKAYTGNRYEFNIGFIDYIGRGTEKLYWEGMKVNVYYSPEDPNVAVLVPGTPNFDPNYGINWVIGGIFIIAFGLVWMITGNIEWFIYFLRKLKDLTN